MVAVKEREREMCGLGLIIDGVVEIFVVGINNARTKNNMICVIAIDEAQL